MVISNLNVDQYDGKWWLRFSNWEAEHFLIRRLLVENLFMITPVLNFTKFTLKANLLILSFSISLECLNFIRYNWKVEQVLLHYTFYMLIMHHFGKTNLGHARR